jgi:hypothetical protein
MKDIGPSTYIERRGGGWWPCGSKLSEETSLVSEALLMAELLFRAVKKSSFPSDLLAAMRPVSAISQVLLFILSAIPTLARVSTIIACRIDLTHLRTSWAG